jgi:hypothetical protein
MISPSPRPAERMQHSTCCGPVTINNHERKMRQPVHDESKPSADLLSAKSFQGFERAFKDARAQKTQDLKTAALRHRHELVEQMIKTKITDADWDELVHSARQAAEHGEKQCLMLRFPSDLCTDGSRAINNPPNDTWPETLRGEAAEIHRRWNDTLRPHGFHLSAQVLEFPDGKPGDVGLFLRWGETA